MGDGDGRAATAAGVLLGRVSDGGAVYGRRGAEGATEEGWREEVVEVVLGVAVIGLSRPPCPMPLSLTPRPEQSPKAAVRVIPPPASRLHVALASLPASAGRQGPPFQIFLSIQPNHHPQEPQHHPRPSRVLHPADDGPRVLTQPFLTRHAGSSPTPHPDEAQMDAALSTDVRIASPTP